MDHITIWIIAFLSISGVIIRPFRIPEVAWALLGAVLMVVMGLITPSDGLQGIKRGTDVYLFLTGMMLLAETAREEKLFDWLAAQATKNAKGSANRLFLLIYLMGVIVTVFLSNDATAVVLTPAVAAAMRSAKVTKPLPYLLICAFIANAASFVLPISNPANLVIYGSRMPTLLQWLPRFFLPSICAILLTFLILKYTQRNALKQKIEPDISIPKLSGGGKMAIIGICATAVILMVTSAMDMQLGLATAIMGVLTCTIVISTAKRNPWNIIKGISWSILPLVAALFVIVEALNRTGIIRTLTDVLDQSAGSSVTGTAWGTGLIVAFGVNLVNNLPAGLIAGNAVQAAHVPEIVKSAIMVATDLGPNLSITGSLATILWLVALRREGLTVRGWTFFKLGLLIMTTALVGALGSLWI